MTVSIQSYKLSYPDPEYNIPPGNYNQFQGLLPSTVIDDLEPIINNSLELVESMFENNTGSSVQLSIFNSTFNSITNMTI